MPNMNRNDNSSSMEFLPKMHKINLIMEKKNQANPYGETFYKITIWHISKLSKRIMKDKDRMINCSQITRD